MKKIISLLLIIATLATMMVGCDKKEVDQPVKDETQVQTHTEPEVQTSTEPEIDGPSKPIEEEPETNTKFSVLGLSPTDKICEIEDMELCDGKTMLSDFTDVTQVENGVYSYMYENLPRDIETWDGFKDITFANMDKSTSYDAYRISLMKPYGSIAGMTTNHLTCLFYVDDVNMTVHEAYEAGLYKYILIHEGTDGFDHFMEGFVNEIAEVAPLQAISEQYGAPTSVFYHDFGNHITFDVIYDLGDKVISINGYEKLEDYEGEFDRIKIQIIEVYGKGSSVYESLTTETEDRIKLK